MRKGTRSNVLVSAMPTTGPTPNDLQTLLRFLMLRGMRRNRSHGGIDLGNQGIKLVRDSFEFGGKATQVAHRQRERAFDANDIGAPPGSCDPACAGRL
ncbi:MAG: hypothetical protein Q8M57_02535 [Nitrosomonas sp.]|nr:hypothetical protein [Nitrosomonas sp.]